MRIEYQHFILPITADVQTELKNLIDAGWAPIPGATPIAIWHMQRIADTTQIGASGGISVKDDGITIISGENFKTN